MLPPPPTPTHTTHPKNKIKTLFKGRSSSIVVSGTEVRRPRGQLSKGVFGASKAVDFELEIGAVLGGPSNPLGQPVGLGDAADRIFGFCLLNDWSARDVQAWEMVPLGPFNGKNWATTVSPWIVTAEAMEPWVRERGRERFFPTFFPHKKMEKKY